MESLAEKLRARIRENGPITFRDFMEAALYDAEFGYYNTERQKIGPAGDYYTASNIHKAFGASLARLFAELLGKPGSQGLPDLRDSNASAYRHYQILEAGAGTGQLARDILEALKSEHPETYSLVSYLIAERSPAMARRQREKLQEYGDRVQWTGLTDNHYPDVEPVAGIIFCNELIDALPVHVVSAVSGDFEELYVVCGSNANSIPLEPSLPGRSSGVSATGPHASSSPSNEFKFSWGPLSSERIRNCLGRITTRLSVGQVLEVNLDAVCWVNAVAGILKSGYLVTIDYGDLAQHLYAQDRRRGTLRAFHRHTIMASALDRVGEQDITSSVNFTALMEYGRDAGLETVSFERQSAFLVRMGLIDRIAAMETHADAQTDLKNKLAIKNLFVPGGASDNFRVLIQRKMVL